MQLRLTDRARMDLAEIERYTRDRWGNRQADAYLAQLESRIFSLLRAPYLGSTRADVSPGYRCLPEGKHLIFYRVANDVVEVLGVPHMRMDVERHLERASEESESGHDGDMEREP